MKIGRKMRKSLSRISDRKSGWFHKKWKGWQLCNRLQTVLHNKVFYIDALCQISGSLPVLLLLKMWQKLFCENFFYIKNILCSVKQTVDIWQMGNCLTWFISPYWSVMLCAKYQEAGLCGSWEKCDRNCFVTTMQDDGKLHRPKKMDSDVVLVAST